MRVMSAGDGYKYLLRTVAAADGDRPLSLPLTRYYAEAGTPPGRWLGGGLSSLGHGEITKGAQVSEAQLQLLLGLGLDPVTGEPLGRAYPSYASVADRIAERLAALAPGLGIVQRAEATVAIEAEEAERGLRRAVAGYDFTFSLPKSASVLWAVADADTQAIIADAHHAAVAEVVAFIERELAATRSGATSRDGAVAQVDVTGLIAVGFDHFDSRAGDPQLHTHVVVSNKVQTAFDGRWRSLDGRPLHAATVALSELHNSVFADHLTRTLGVTWERRERDGDRNPVWSIATVPEALVAEFSSRSQHIDIEKDRLIADYVATHGHAPSKTTIIRLRQQATLTTRPDKEMRPLTALTHDWRTRASHLLRRDATVWAREAVRVEAPALLRADDVPLDVIAGVGKVVVTVVGEKRTTWGRWNLYAEAARQTMGWRFAATEDREAIVGMIADAAERASLRLTPPEPATSPAVFQRSDGTSVFRPRNSARYTATALLEAEDRLLAFSRDTCGPVISSAALARAAHTRGNRAGALGADQRAALESIAASGRALDLLVGPAGAGKTTAMNELRRAWESQHGEGSVVGLAPSATAAQALAEDLGISTENTAKWWQNFRDHGIAFTTGQLVIVDEASLAGTLSLDRLTQIAARAGAKVLLVGDWAQLQSVDAGGAFAMLVSSREDVPELADVHRFVHDWEKSASLELRHGRPTAIHAYEAHSRVVGGEAEQMADAAYAGWRQDRSAGLASILIAETGGAVTALNQRARADLVLVGDVDAGAEVALHDGTAASVGDMVLTRRNERTLRAGREWVRNGDRWLVSAVKADGAMMVRRVGRRWGGAIVLPAEYVAENVELGYAVTAYRAQGITTDTAHALIEPGTTRENLYVSMTRGRQGNKAYVSVSRPDEDHSTRHPADQAEANARSVLYGVLQHVGAELSAHQTIATEQDSWGSVAQLAAEYETIAGAAQQERWAALLLASGLAADEAAAAIASTAFSALGAELRRAEADGYDVDRLLPRLAAARGVSAADDIAAVLHERVARAISDARGAGRVRKPLRPIAGLITPAVGPMAGDMHIALCERRDLIEQRADALVDEAVRGGAPWLSELGGAPNDPQHAQEWRREVRIVAAYRDRHGIADESALGNAVTTAQRGDMICVRAALERARRVATDTAAGEWQACTVAGAPPPSL
ncbi:MobF family relaxase [Salinibacterium sp. ZJ450]|uniref:MobF family relaxase n=1 Tax=Salinibacterium sp. ZJ450 TaxID=2708338 RepID=UPI00141DA1E9|nr:MobF family relaxase [Salinibacterium sp. ZJ450]